MHQRVVTGRRALARDAGDAIAISERAILVRMSRPPFDRQRKTMTRSQV
jgi:hypothetical protein